MEHEWIHRDAVDGGESAVIQSTTIRRNRLSGSRHERRPAPGPPRAFAPSFTRPDGSIEITPFEELGIPHMEAFPHHAAQVLTAARAESEDHAVDLQVTFGVEPPDVRPYVAYIGVDPPIGDGDWEAVLDSGGPEIRETDDGLVLLSAGWTPDDERQGQWYRSWPGDTPALTVAAQIGLMMIRVLNPGLTGDWHVGIPVFEDDPDVGRMPVGDATNTVLARVSEVARVEPTTDTAVRQASALDPGL